MIVLKKIADRILETEVELNKDIFCPKCGKKEVYTEMSEGDYYEGPYNYCKNCKCEFTMPSCGVNENLEFKNN